MLLCSVSIYTYLSDFKIYLRFIYSYIPNTIYIILSIINRRIRTNHKRISYYECYKISMNNEYTNSNVQDILSLTLILLIKV